MMFEKITACLLVLVALAVAQPWGGGGVSICFFLTVICSSCVLFYLLRVFLPLVILSEDVVFFLIIYVTLL